MNPKPLSDAVHKGLAYLVNQQQPGGGWCQGGGWRSGEEGRRIEGPQVEDPADVANTCMATLALLRAGNTPRDGRYSAESWRALDYVMTCIESSDAESPYVTEVRGSQVQSKIGLYADTSLATMLLAEARGHMASPEAEARLTAALDKVVAKMERHQGADGSWTGASWAPVVGQALAAAGLNRAKQRGTKVSDEVLEKSEMYSRGQFNRRTKKYAMGGSAGVGLYATASHLAAGSHSVATLQAEKLKARRVMETETAAPEEKVRATEKLKYIDDAETSQAMSMEASMADLRDEQFIAGFGSNGGEEFLSYLNISETLLIKGGEEWERWDKRMTENLERIQNADGSWTGHHCITGRTFCTAAALLVLLADRMPRPDAVVS